MGMAATGTESIVDKLAVVEVEVIVGILSDGPVVSFADIAEMTFPSTTASEKDEWSKIELAVTLARWTSALAEPSSLALLSASQVSHFHSSR
jgi:hypothetical protein